MNKLNKEFITFLFVILSLPAWSQKEGNIWYFGNYAGLDFNSGSPVALTNGALHTNEGCSSISDSAGNLLFYTDGVSVWDNTHTTMMNGTGLTGNITSTQSAMIIKQPGTQNIYYIFSLFSDYCYSVVDMTLNGGLGAVTAAKNVMIMAGANSEKQCATRHANGIDIWIVMHTGGAFYAYSLTASGFNPVPVQSTIGANPSALMGQMKFSPKGDRIVFGYYNSPSMPNICLLDFDNSSGIVSNSIDIPNGDYQCYGVEFSPDGSKLYATGNPNTVKKIYQYDINAGSPAAIIASQIQAGSTLSGDISGLQTGPDGKIYICLDGSNFLAVINDPDSAGLACNYLDNAVNLGTGTCKLGLPELISDYFNPPLGINNYQNEISFTIFPNPATDYLYLSHKNFRKPYSVMLNDLTGNIILRITVTASEQKLNISKLAKGVYLLNVNDEEKTLLRKVFLY